MEATQLLPFILWHSFPVLCAQVHWPAFLAIWRYHSCLFLGALCLLFPGTRTLPAPTLTWLVEFHSLTSKAPFLGSSFLTTLVPPGYAPKAPFLACRVSLLPMMYLGHFSLTSRWSIWLSAPEGLECARCTHPKSLPQCPECSQKTFDKWWMNVCLFIRNKKCPKHKILRSSLVFLGNHAHHPRPQATEIGPGLLVDFYGQKRTTGQDFKIKGLLDAESCNWAKKMGLSPT